MYNKPCICNTGGAQKPRRRGYAMDMKIKRNILLNPGPSTTTDTVKLAQVVPDICPREREFADVMADFRRDLLRVVHADPDVYTAVLFCGSGTLNIDVCLNSLLPAGGKVLVVNNGAYSTRALVHTTHNETGTGILNPIREIGALAHRYGAVFTVDTTSTLAMRPIDVQADNIDFCMASAQKGLMAMTGLSFVIGRRDVIEASRDYPRRSYYCNLWLQYDFFERTGQMHFTPPVQTVYAAVQGLKEYFAEGEQAKWARHTRVFEAIHEGLDRLGFRDVIRREWQAGLVVSAIYPDDPNWDFEKVHDYCYERGFTIYPGKISTTNTFRLCALGAIDEADIRDFFAVFTDALRVTGVRIPVMYRD